MGWFGLDQSGSVGDRSCLLPLLAPILIGLAIWRTINQPTPR